MASQAVSYLPSLSEWHWSRSVREEAGKLVRKNVVTPGQWLDRSCLEWVRMAYVSGRSRSAG